MNSDAQEALPPTEALGLNTDSVENVDATRVTPANRAAVKKATAKSLNLSNVSLDNAASFDTDRAPELPTVRN